MNEYEDTEENLMPMCCLCSANLDSKPTSFTKNTTVGIQCNPEVNSQGVQCELYTTESKRVQCDTEVNSVVQKCVSYSSKEVQCDLINLELLLFKCKATQWENECVCAPLHSTQPNLSFGNNCETKTQFVENTHSTQSPLKEEANNDARSITSETTIHIGNSSMSVSCSSIEVVSDCDSSQSFHSSSDLETCKKSVQKKEKKINNWTKKTERYENEEIVKTNVRKGDCCVTIDDGHNEVTGINIPVTESLNNHQNCHSAEDSQNNESKIMDIFGVERRGTCTSEDDISSTEDLAEKGPADQLQAYCTDSHLKDLSGVSCDKQMENSDLSMTSKHTEKNVLHNQMDSSSISHTIRKNTTKKMNKYKRYKKSSRHVCYSDSENTSPENDNMLSVSEEHNRDSNHLSENRSDEVSRFKKNKRKHQVKGSTTPGSLRDERVENKSVRNVKKKKKLYIHHTDSEPEFIDYETEFSDAESDISSRNQRKNSLPKITNKLDVKSRARKVKNHVPCDIWDSDSASGIDHNSDTSPRRTYQTSITCQSNISQKNQGRRPYSKKENDSILQYIIQKKVYKLVKGRALWEEMENQNICDRSWQSMKEHFRRQILPYIDEYCLDPAITKKFKKML